MNVKRWLGIVGFACSSAAALLACTHEVKTPTPKPRIVVIRGNVATPVHCECEAAERRARAWKAYAIKLETQLGIPPSASSRGLP